MDFADLPQALTLSNDVGGVISNFLGPWHGLSVHGFHGVWAAPNASLIIPNAARYALNGFLISRLAARGQGWG